MLWIVNTSRTDQVVPVTVDWAALGFPRQAALAVNAETGTDIALADTGFTVPVLKRDFVAVLLVHQGAMDPGLSFVATFDHGQADADHAIGCERLVGDAEIVDGDRGKALAPAAQGVALWSHLNLNGGQGRLAFRARTGTGHGRILRTEASAPHGDRDPLAPALVVETRKAGKDGNEIVLRLDAKATDDPMAQPAVTPRTLAPGWHEFIVTWNDGTVSLNVDATPVGTIKVPGLNIPAAIGPGLLRSARVVIGGRGPVDAIDDLRAWRTAGSVP
jgi:hypothetical protein